jgi:hypothetical protein
MKIMFGNETERQYLIERLKTVRDPVERDRIVWKLAGQEKAEKRPAPKLPDSQEIPENLERFPELPAGARNTMRYLLPGILFFYGIVTIVQAVAKYVTTGPNGEMMMQLALGAIFIAFGFIMMRKAKEAQNKLSQRSDLKTV